MLSLRMAGFGAIPLRSWKSQVRFPSRLVVAGRFRRRCHHCGPRISIISRFGHATQFWVRRTAGASGGASLGGLDCGFRCRDRVRKARDHLFRHQPDTFFCLLVVEKPRSADKDEIRKPADVIVNRHDLPIDGVRVAGDENAAGNRLVCGNADQAVGGPAGALTAWPRARWIIPSGNRRRRPARQKSRHLRRLFEARVQKPQQLAADTQPLFVGVADISKCGISEPVGTGQRQPRLAPRDRRQRRACLLRAPAIPAR
jgi:hypothetical protein